jgi:hypothetical protein
MGPDSGPAANSRSLEAATDAETEQPAPHATAAAYRLLAASLSAGAVRDRLLKKAAELDAEAKRAASNDRRPKPKVG